MAKTELMIALLGAAALAASPALAASGVSEEKIDSLEQQIQSLQDEVQDLKAGNASQFTESQRQISELPKVSLANGRPTIATADGNFSASLRALVQFDSAYYSQSPEPAASVTDLSSGTNFRRARIGLEGTLWKVWDYSFMYDFGGSGVEGSTISQAYLQYNGFAPVAVRIGAFPPFASLEDSAGAADTLFIERASAVEITRSLAGGDGRSAAALIATGPRYLASIAYTGGKVGQSGLFDEQQAAVGRLAYLVLDTPDAKAVLGVNGTYVFDTADSSAGPGSPSTGINFQNAPELRVDATNLVSTGNINAQSAYHWGIDGGANWKSLYLEGGYFGFGADARGTSSDPDFNGWYTQASWILTGETRRYDASRGAFRSPKVANPVNGKAGGWGAWEIAARYSTVDLDFDPGAAGTPTPTGGIRGGQQNIVTAGLNWYPNDALRVLLNYQHSEIDRLNGSGAQAGQDIDAVSLRLQISL